MTENRLWANGVARPVSRRAFLAGALWIEARRLTGFGGREGLSAERGKR